MVEDQLHPDMKENYLETREKMVKDLEGYFDTHDTNKDGSLSK